MRCRRIVARAHSRRRQPGGIAAPLCRLFRRQQRCRRPRRESRRRRLRDGAGKRRLHAAGRRRGSRSRPRGRHDHLQCSGSRDFSPESRPPDHFERPDDHGKRRGQYHHRRRRRHDPRPRVQSRRYDRLQRHDFWSHDPGRRRSPPRSRSTEAESWSEISRLSISPTSRSRITRRTLAAELPRSASRSWTIARSSTTPPFRLPPGWGDLRECGSRRRLQHDPGERCR